MYELCRIFTLAFEPGDEIEINNSVPIELPNSNIKRVGWYCFSDDPREELYEDVQGSVICTKRFTYLMAYDFANEDDSERSSLLDDMEFTRLEETWGEETIYEVARYAAQFATTWKHGKATYATLVGVFEHKETEKTWKFIGEVPVDEWPLGSVVSDA